MDGYDERDWGTGLRALGAAVGIARGVQNLEAEPERAEGQWLRNQVLMRELEGPSPREKFAFEQSKVTWEKRTEQNKFVINTFSELSKTADQATKKVLLESFGSFWAGMTNQEQAAVKMIYDNSPLNPMKQKGGWFDEMYPAPEVNADPSANPHGYALQMFNLEDYSSRRQGFMTGQVPPARRVLGLAENVWGFRDDDGKVSVMRTEDFALQQIAKQFGENVTVGELLLNNGFMYGKPREVMVDGVLSNVRNVFDAMKNRPMPAEVTPVQGAIGSLQKEQQDLQGFLAAWATNDTTGKTEGSRAYKSINEMRTKGTSNEAVIDWVRTVYPGYNFKIVDEGAATLRGKIPFVGGMFNAYARGDKERLIAWPGTRRALKTSDGKDVMVYYDARSGRVYDPGGRIVPGSIDELEAYISGKTMSEIQVETKR